MGAPYGHKKYENAGRKLGTPNKITMDIVKQLDELGYNPLSELILIQQAAIEQFNASARVLAVIRQRENEVEVDDDAPKVYITQNITGYNAEYLRIAKDCTADVMKYIYPVRKPVEGSGTLGEEVAKSFATIAHNIAKLEQKP